MTTDVATLSPETSLRDAMELLTRRQISGAPVVSGRTIHGVVSTSDLMAFTSALPDVPAPPSGMADDLEWDAPATEAELDDLDVIHRVLVVDDGELVCILSTLDIANAVADGRLVTRTHVFNHDAAFADKR
jgi:CBS domain-containing protein